MLTQLKYFSEKYIFKKNTEKNGIVTYLQISLNVWLNMTADFPYQLLHSICCDTCHTAPEKPYCTHVGE